MCDINYRTAENHEDYQYVTIFFTLSLPPTTKQPAKSRLPNNQEYTYFIP